MNKVWIFLFSLLLAGSALAGGGTTALTTSSTVLLGDANRRGNAPAWVASTAYAQGVSASANGFVFMALTNGTSGATAPVPTASGDVTDNTVTWRVQMQTPRNGLFLKNVGSTTVTIHWSSPAVDGRGMVMAPNDVFVTTGVIDTPQGRVVGISRTSTGSFVAYEW